MPQSGFSCVRPRANYLDFSIYMAMPKPNPKLGFISVPTSDFSACPNLGVGPIFDASRVAGVATAILRSSLCIRLSPESLERCVRQCICIYCTYFICVCRIGYSSGLRSSEPIVYPGSCVRGSKPLYETPQTHTLTSLMFEIYTLAVTYAERCLYLWLFSGRCVTPLYQTSTHQCAMCTCTFSLSSKC